MGEKRVGGGPDYYAALGIAPGAADGEVRAAFRRLARQYHPDVNPDPGAAERFRAVVAAYEVLSDPRTRAAYDAQRTSGGRRPGASAGRRATEPGQRPPPVRGLDRHSTVRVPADVLERGGVAQLDHRRWERCERCGGSGRLAEEVPCPVCGGAGFLNGRISDPCRACWTSGLTSVCPDCNGRGGRWQPKHIEVTVPPGRQYGQQLRLRGMGDAGPRGGPPGDLYVELAPPLPPAVQAVASHELVQAALRRLEEWLDRFAPYPT